MKKARLMVVDDDKNTRKLIQDILKATGLYTVAQAASGEACLRKIAESPVDLVMLDMQMPGIDGLETLRRIKAKAPELPVIIMTAHGTVESAVDSMKGGSYDFLTKPFPAERLKVTVHNALEASELQSEVHSLRSAIQSKYDFTNIIGQSGVMQELFGALEKIVKSEVTVLIQGESGTGKELFARAIHQHSPERKNRPFVAVNCTALPESLLESELFGHEKGAFTGAASKRIGKFELADGGTIFLDEIGDMSLSTQAKILRVLQEREFERVGGNALVKVNIRFISATNKNLVEEVAAGRFREDLFYRLSVFPIKLPPLRDRVADIALLAAHFLKRYGDREGKRFEGLTQDAARALTGYHWPGNVRELENVIERAVVISSGRQIILDDLSPYVRSGQLSTKFTPAELDVDQETLPQWIEKLELDILKRTLLEFEGNISQTARKLGIGRATVYRKAKKHNLPISR